MYTYSLNEIMPLKMIMLHLRAIENLTNSLVSGMRNLLKSCWLWESRRLLKQQRLLLLPSAASQKLKAKSPLLKTLSTLDARQRGLELDLTTSPLPED